MVFFGFVIVKDFQQQLCLRDDLIRSDLLPVHPSEDVHVHASNPLHQLTNTWFVLFDYRLCRKKIQEGCFLN